MAVAGTAVMAAGDVLAPYVPRLAAEWAASGPAGQPWRVVEGTLVFADISGFTALSERLAKQGPVGAEELTEVLGRCFAELLAVAYARGGSLVKFGGDALLLLFDGEGHAARGVDAALGMRATMRRVGRLVTSVGNVHLRMSLGVHSGPVHAFLVGGSHRELLLVGPGPSTVVTMEGTADAGEIVVSPATASRLDASLVAGAKGPGVLLRPRVDAAPLPTEVETSFPARAAADDAALAAGVPTLLREHLLAGGGESEHRHASIAFLHFDGTDELIARRGVEWAAGALERLVRDVQAAAEEHGATFLASDLDHDGGKLILVGGVPRSLGDDDGRVLRAVRQVVDASAAAVAAGEGIPVRVGINRGPVFVGAVGPPYRRTFTVMGDAVNLAARLMAKASRGQVLASAGVLAQSRTAFSTTALEPFFVKGKSRPVQAFAVGAALGTQETRRSARLPLVGRDAELEVLTEAWTAAAEGRGRVVVLSGEVGVGKTRLVEELRTIAGAAGGDLRLVQCEQYEERTPYFAFRVLLRRLLGLRADATPRGLASAVCAVDSDLAEWVPLVGDVVNIACPDTPSTSSIEPQFRGLRTRGVIVRLLESLVVAPTVLAFDDVQWMDNSSQEVLQRLLPKVDRHPWLVCVTKRDGSDAVVDVAGLGGSSALHLPLHPIGHDAARDLIRNARRHDPLPPHRLDALVARAGGNPLFLEELAAIATVDDDAALPESLEAVACAQIDRLPPAAGRVLRVAAVLGVSFDRSLLETLLPGHGGDVDNVSDLADHLVVERDGRIRFRHRLIRDAAYDLLPFRRRRELHLRAAQSIEARAGDAPDEVAEVLALHYEQAQQHEATWRYGRLAATRASAKGAPADAVAHHERALAAVRRVPGAAPDEVADAWVELSIDAGIAGFHERSRSALRVARRLLSDDPVALAGLCFREARMATAYGRSRDVVRWIRRGLRHIEGREGPEAAAKRAQLLALYAYVRQQYGRPREAIAAAQRLIELEAPAPTSASALAQAYLVLDWAHIDLGQADLATNAAGALDLLEREQEFGELALALNNLGAFAYFQGRWQDALDLYARSTSTFEKIGDLVDAALSVANRAEILTLQGRLEEAERMLEEIIELWSAMSFRYGLAIATRHLARVRLRQGDLDVAIDGFRSARETFALYQQAGKLIEIDAWLAECLLRRGDVPEAVELVADALERERSSGSSEMMAMLHRLAGYAAAAQRRLVDAWASFDASLHAARSRGSSYDVALALEGMAVVARLGGPATDAIGDQERAALLAELGVTVLVPPPIALSA